jgi:hypothetical protein
MIDRPSAHARGAFSSSQENAMSKLSRRSLVSSAAALSALAVPAVASALPASDDIELQQLGVRLLRVKRELDAICAAPTDGEEYEAQMNIVHPQLCALMDPIFERTAATVDGLAVQAAAATIAGLELWDVDPDQEPELQIERRFIEAVCRYTGVKHPAINTKFQDRADNAQSDDERPKSDPMLAAVEAHRKAYDEVAIKSCRAFSIAEYRVGVGNEKNPEWQEAHEALLDAWDIEAEAKENMLDTVPTTPSGAKALVDWFALNLERSEDWPLQREQQEPFCKVLSAALARFA